MADTKISALAAETSFNGTEQIPIVSLLGANKKMTLAGIVGYYNFTNPKPIYVVKLRGTSSGAAPQDVTTDSAVHSSFNEWVIDNGYGFLAEAYIIGINSGGALWAAKQLVCVQVLAGSGVVTINAAPAPTTVFRSSGATDWVVTLTADSTNSGAYYVGNGTSATPINWYIDLQIFSGI